MADARLDKMSVKELTALQARIDDAIVERKKSDFEDLKSRIATIAERSGFSLRDLFKGRGTRRNGATKRSKVAVKYRDPQNPSNTWTGRGRPPRWLAAKVAAGQKREKFLIS